MTRTSLLEKCKYKTIICGHRCQITQVCAKKNFSSLELIYYYYYYGRELVIDFARGKKTIASKYKISDQRLPVVDESEQQIHKTYTEQMCQYNKINSTFTDLLIMIMGTGQKAFDA